MLVGERSGKGLIRGWLITGWRLGHLKLSIVVEVGHPLNGIKSMTLHQSRLFSTTRRHQMSQCTNIKPDLLEDFPII